MRRVVDAGKSRATDLSLSLCCGLSEAKLRLLYNVMAAPDFTAALSIVAKLIGVDDDAEGLPARAVAHDDGSVTLPLLYAATDGDGVERSELVFQKLKAEALKAMAAAPSKDTIAVGLPPLAWSTTWTPPI
jgi:hypothetical protein